MEITNMKYIWCPRCGTEARGFDDINEKFGYRIKNRKEVVPFQKCKSCRGEQQNNVDYEKIEEKSSWLSKHYTAARWAREIHMNVSEFNNYLCELGYLEENSNNNKNKQTYQLTEKGKEHTNIRTFMGRVFVLWDFDVFVDVLMRSAISAVALLQCPRCNSVLGELSNEHPIWEEAEKCEHCGFVGKERIIRFANN